VAAVGEGMLAGAVKGGRKGGVVAGVVKESVKISAEFGVPHSANWRANSPSISCRSSRIGDYYSAGIGHN
jgi:hypothetical protein